MLSSVSIYRCLTWSLTLSEGACMLSVSQHISLTLSEGACSVSQYLSLTLSEGACSLSVSIYRWLCQSLTLSEGACSPQSASIADFVRGCNCMLSVSQYLSLTLSEGACSLSVSMHLLLTLSEGATACSLSLSIYRWICQRVQLHALCQSPSQRVHASSVSQSLTVRGCKCSLSVSIYHWPCQSFNFSVSISDFVRGWKCYLSVSISLTLLECASALCQSACIHHWLCQCSVRIFVRARVHHIADLRALILLVNISALTLSEGESAICLSAYVANFVGVSVSQRDTVRGCKCSLWVSIYRWLCLRVLSVSISLTLSEGARVFCQSLTCILSISWLCKCFLSVHDFACKCMHACLCRSESACVLGPLGCLFLYRNSFVMI
jgi:hypothetical protein